MYKPDAGQRATPSHRRRASRRATHDRALGALRALVDALTHSARAVETRTGLTNAQLAILRQVGRAGPLTVNEIAARVRAGQSAVSIVVGRLAKARLVRRFESAEDRRRVMVDVTPAGRRVLQRSPHSPTEELLTALSRLPGRETAMLADGLDALLRSMGRRVVEPPMLFE